MSTDLKVSKVQISKIIQSGGFLGSLLSKLAGPLMKIAVPLAKNLSTIGAGIKKIHGSGNTTLIISNKKKKNLK